MDMDPSNIQVTTSADNLGFSVGYQQDLLEMDADFHTTILREERRCRYPSKRCELPRAIKRDGKMHRFCEVHRDRANLNQRRLEARRKWEVQEMERSQRDSSSSSLPVNETYTKLPPGSEPQFDVDPCVASPPLHSVLAEDELNFLSELLSQSSLEDLPIEGAGGTADISTNLFPFDHRFHC